MSLPGWSECGIACSPRASAPGLEIAFSTGLLALLGFVDGHIYQDSKAISINLNIEALIALDPET